MWRWKADLVVPQLFLLLKIAQEISHTLQNLVLQLTKIILRPILAPCLSYLLIGESDEISLHFRNLLSNSSVLKHKNMY